MTSLNDPTIDGLRDLDGNLQGHAPAQEWLKPERVTLRPRISLSGLVDVETESPIQNLAGLMALKSGMADMELKRQQILQSQALWQAQEKKALGGAELEFVVHAPAFVPASVRRIKPKKEILEKFLRLGTASDSEIHAFAARFGPLLIYYQGQAAGMEHQRIVIEKCDVWRYFAACMGALLRIAAKFHLGHTPDPTDWETIGNCPFTVSNAEEPTYDWMSPTPLHGEGAWEGRTYFIRKGDRGRAMWTGLLNLLLELGRVRPWVIWQGSGSAARPQLMFSGPNLLSYLALQLSLTASKHDAFAVCSYCNKEYSPLRRAPKAGQRNFCPDCRANGVPVRIGQRLRKKKS